VAVYSLGFPLWPVVILQVHIPKTNNSRGSFLDTEQEVELAMVIPVYDDYCSLFEMLDSGLFLTQKEQWLSGSAVLQQGCLCYQPSLAD